MNFHINIARVIRPVKWNSLSFSSMKINKPLFLPVKSVSKVIFKLRNEL